MEWPGQMVKLTQEKRSKDKNKKSKQIGNEQKTRAWAPRKSNENENFIKMIFDYKTNIRTNKPNGHWNQTGLGVGLDQLTFNSELKTKSNIKTFNQWMRHRLGRQSIKE